METAIIISSSPPVVAAASRDARAFSSSPFGDLPSPSTLSRKQNAVLKSGSNMMQPPEGALMGFASARNLLGKFEAVETEQEAMPALQKKASVKRRTSAPKNPEKAKTASTRKPRAKKQPKSAEFVVSDDEETALDNAGLTTATVPNKDSENVEERRGSVSGAHEEKTTGKRKRAVKTPKEGKEKPRPKPRKRVASAEKVDGATSKRGASAPKTKAIPKSKGKDTAEVAATGGTGVVPTFESMRQESHHFVGSKPGDAVSKARGDVVVDEQDPLHLEPEPEPESEVIDNQYAAPTRRRSWTPVNHDLPTSFQEERASDEENDESKDASKSFSHLVGAFALPSAGPVLASETKPQTVKKTPTRKKRVDGAEGVPKARAKSAKPKVDKPKKEKAKKAAVPKEPKQQRLKNVTAYALAAYQQTEGVPDTNAADRLAPYLETQPKLTNADGDTVDDLPDSAKARQKLGRIKFDFPMPDKACQKLKSQDFVFGTSSQLARDESPTFLRQTQQAIQESEEAAWLSQAASQEMSPSSRMRVAQAPHGTSLSIAQSAGRLWGVATRDGDQKMFAGDERPQKSLTNDDDGFRDGDDLDEQRSHINAEPAPEVDERQDSGFVDISDTEAAAIISSQIKHAEEPVMANDRILQRQMHSVEETMPGARQVLQEIDANASLHKSITESAQLPDATSLSKVRSQRTDQQQLDDATKELDTTSRRSSKEALVEEKPKPAKPRGRPPGSKNLLKSAAQSSTPRKAKKLPSSPFKDIDDIDEISDSEAASATPSPPRRMASSPPVSPIPLRLSPKASDVAMTSQITQPLPEDKTLDCADVFAEISRVIKAQPLTRDLTRPTWYEKILLYDPIVLEDLTAWLNEQGLRMEVEKSKTASKSKGKSKAKSRGPELDLVNSQGQKVSINEQVVEKVKEELKPAFVQRWCETNSICCLWKEGLRGGVRQKY